MLTIVFMAVTSAGSAEMMAVSSLVTYDIYKVKLRVVSAAFNGQKCSNPTQYLCCHPP